MNFIGNIMVFSYHQRVIKLPGNKYFTINGRVDNIINSGGFKVSSENIEELLYENFQNKSFFIDKIKCDKLGEKIILIADEKIKLQEFSLFYMQRSIGLVT